MIVLVLLFLGCYINPSLSDYYNNINTIQTADDPHHTTKDLFELTHTLFQNINSYSGLINLESVPRIFKTNTNLVQTLASSQTVVHVITLMTAQASVSLSQSYKPGLVLLELLIISVDFQHRRLVPHIPVLELRQGRQRLLGPSDQRRSQQRPSQSRLRPNKPCGWCWGCEFQ